MEDVSMCVTRCVHAYTYVIMSVYECVLSTKMVSAS